MKAEISRTFIRWRFFAAVMLSAFVGILDILTLDHFFDYDMTQLYRIKCDGWGMMFMLSLAAGTMPGILGLYEDRENNIAYMLIARNGEFRYALRKTLVCAMAAFCTSIFGDVIFSIVTFSISGEFISDKCIEYYAEDSVLLGKGHFVLYYLIWMAMQGLRVAFYALLSQGIAVFMKNKFAILSLPVVLYYVVINFTYYVIEVPKYLDPYVIYRNFMIFMGNEPLSFLYAFVYTIIVCFAIVLMIYYDVRRRKKKI